MFLRIRVVYWCPIQLTKKDRRPPAKAAATDKDEYARPPCDGSCKYGKCPDEGCHNYVKLVYPWRRYLGSQ